MINIGDWARNLLYGEKSQDGQKGVVNMLEQVLAKKKQNKQKEVDDYFKAVEARQAIAHNQVKDDPRNNDYVYKGVVSEPTPTVPTSTPTPVPPTPSPTITPTPPPDKSAMAYYEAINKAAKENNIPQDILYNLLAKESMHFNPDVISGALSSPAGAKGIAQFMPDTAKGMGFDPLDAEVAIKKAAEYLAAKKKRHGTWEKALASYNAGSGAVEEYGGVPPYEETINYVKDIIKNSKI